MSRMPACRQSVIASGTRLKKTSTAPSTQDAEPARPLAVEHRPVGREERVAEAVPDQGDLAAVVVAEVGLDPRRLGHHRERQAIAEVDERAALVVGRLGEAGLDRLDEVGVAPRGHGGQVEHGAPPGGDGDVEDAGSDTPRGRGR